MSREHFRIGGFWYKSCAKHSSLLVCGCARSTAHLHRLQSRPADIFWHREQAHSLPSSASPSCSSHTCTSPSSQLTYTSFIQHSPWKEQFPFLSSMHAPKEAARNSNSRLSSTTPTQHETPDSPGPRNQYSVTNLRSNKALGTHLDLTFLKTSSTYAEGCKRGKTPALHIKKHSRTNMYLKVHLTQLKTRSHVLWDGQIKLNITEETPSASSSCQSEKPSLPKHKPSLLRLIQTGEQYCEKSNLYSTS